MHKTKHTYDSVINVPIVEASTGNVTEMYAQHMSS